MALNSIKYLIFLAVSAGIHAALPTRFRNVFLLAASAVFCAASGLEMLLIPCAVILLSFFGAKAIFKADEPQKHRLLLTFSSLLIVTLCFFKYANIWNSFLREPVTILLPLGISFFTFEALGYLIDVYHGKLEPESNLLNWALAIFFFPQFSSGPIARAKELLPQVRDREVTYAKTTEGLRRILMGAVAKIAVADALGILVNAFYGDMAAHTGLSVLLAVFLYPLQIFFDFSGYSSMAIGSALLFGIRLRENFNAPFFATSLGEVWKRWHMSLTSWFQDYVFTPLVWNRWWNKLWHPKDWQSRPPHMLANLAIVFLLSGIWHGNTINYAFWGLLMALGRIAEETVPVLKRKRKSAAAMFFGRVGVYLWWVVTHIFFRLATVHDVKMLFANILRPTSPSNFVGDVLHVAANSVGNSGTYYLIFFGSIFFGIALQYLFDRKMDRSLRKKGSTPCTDPIATYSRPVRWALYWLMGFVAVAMYLITTSSAAPSFIYVGY